jgi:succinate dehydrogenase / fumarate reductase flavoprotein subunit
MCREPIAAVVELEHSGMPFSRTEAGKIHQRRFGGPSTDYAKGDRTYRACRARPHRPCHPAHAISALPKAPRPRFSIEYFAPDLLLDEDGLRAWRMDRSLATTVEVNRHPDRGRDRDVHARI